jgi:hypothetical protein
MKTELLIIHEEEDPKVIINRFTDYNPNDIYFVGYVFGGYDWVMPIRDSSLRKEFAAYNELFSDTVKVKDFPFEEQKVYIHEIIDNHGESLWNDEYAGCAPSTERIEDVFSKIDKELYCTLCCGAY